MAAATNYKNEVAQNLIQDFKYNFLTSAIVPIKRILDSYIENCLLGKTLAKLGKFIPPPSKIPRSLVAGMNGDFKSFPQDSMPREKVGGFIVIPIPLSKKRLRERGFNQAELIAKYVAEKFNLPIVQDVLIKIKDSPKQSEAKNYKERLKNVEGCFAVKNPELIKGKNIILVDDVFTSGATVKEAIKNLKIARIKKVIVFTVARAGH